VSDSGLGVADGAGEGARVAPRDVGLSKHSTAHATDTDGVFITIPPCSQRSRDATSDPQKNAYMRFFRAIQKTRSTVI
jgi:hypothetical protein